MNPDVIWKHRPIWLAFWAINIGLMLEILLSLLPVGLLQTYRSVSVGYWSARSPEFLQTDLMQTLRWMRMIGDTVFAVGAIAFVYFALDSMLRQRGARVAVRTEVAVETV
jgi:nitric oxide reductase subunit B